MLFGIKGIRNASHGILAFVVEASVRISDVEADGAVMLCKEASEFLIGISTLLFLIGHVHHSGDAIASPRLPKQISERSSFGIFRWLRTLLGRQLLVSYLICPPRSDRYLPFLVALAPRASSISAVACSPAYSLSSSALHEIHQARCLHYFIDPGNTPGNHTIEVSQIPLPFLGSPQLLEAAHALVVHATLELLSLPGAGIWLPNAGFQLQVL